MVFDVIMAAPEPQDVGSLDSYGTQPGLVEASNTERQGACRQH